jgi:RNA polymerase subunit RPABC4/transcription elongation factor Spt4
MQGVHGAVDESEARKRIGGEQPGQYAMRVVSDI